MDAATQPTGQPAVPLKKDSAWIGPFSIFYVLVSFFASQIIAGITLLRYGSSKGWSVHQVDSWLNSSIPAQFCFVLISEVLLIAAMYAGLRMLRWSWSKIGLTRPKLWQIGVGIASTVPYYILYIIIVAVVSRFIPALNVNQKQDVGFTDVAGAGALVMTFVSLVILPPLAEEITMRGFLFTGLRTWTPTIVAGLLVSLLFGAAHLTEGGDAGPLWIGAIDTFTLSLVLVYLRVRTGNLWAGITLHACKNGIAFLLLYVLHVN